MRDDVRRVVGDESIPSLRHGEITSAARLRDAEAQTEQPHRDADDQHQRGTFTFEPRVGPGVHRGRTRLPQYRPRRASHRAREHHLAADEVRRGIRLSAERPALEARQRA